MAETRVRPSPPRASPWWNRRSTAFRRTVLVLYTLLPARVAPANVTKEYEVKAAFLYNFAKFVEWPPSSFPDDHAPLVIGVFGANPFGDELEEMVRGRKLGGRDIAVEYIDTAEQAKTVQVLFVSRDEDQRVDDLLQALASCNVLVVGESDRFSAAKGMIRFFVEGDRVRFDIDVARADGVGLKISAQLQKLARAVIRRER
jgi:YfiR/HmsC-like